ncbi:MAG TPA: peptidyl-prolyl cis-trans isomerase [Verrucomicrobiae bacterium]|nr:peptidyl-prolyl cis-trans isomerase [Verrucomicrobiae bacterium]
MFIAHGEWLRKYAPWILAGVLLLLLPGFVLLFSPTGSVKREISGLPTIGGKPINPAEFQREKTVVTAQLIMRRGRELSRTAEVEDDLNIDTAQRLLLMRKAKELGIRASDDDVVRQIRAQPVFLNAQRQFDPGRYQRFVIYLNNLGVSETMLEEIMREQVMLGRLRALVVAGEEVTPTELKLNYVPLHEQTTIDYVEFDLADYKEPITIKENDAKAYYERNREALRTPAQVKVRYVYFTLAAARKSITLSDDDVAEYYDRNKDKYLDAENKPKPLAEVKAQVQKELLDLRAERLAGDQATAFSVKLVYEPGTQRPDFAKIAAQSGVTPHETGFFTIHDTIPGVDAGQPFNQAALALSPEEPFSDPVRGEDGYYVLEYVAGKPSEIPTFEEAKQEVVDRLKRQLAYEAIVKRGREDATKVEEAVTAGKSFSAACTELGLKVKSAPPFTAVDETLKLPAAQVIQEVALGMRTNSVSEFIPTPKGGVFFYLKQRTPPKPGEFEKDKDELEARILARDRDALFADWINALMLQARVEYKRKAPPRTTEPPPEETEPAEEPAPANG